MNLETRLDNLYHDPAFGWWTKQASETTAVLGERHKLSKSTVWEHMQKCGVTASTPSTRWREGLIHSDEGPLFYGYMLSCWPRSLELSEHVTWLKSQ